jgi:GNAT superfamily N-acetyltransferase
VTASPETGVVAYERVGPEAYAALVPELGELLADAVESGASVNFLKPFSVAEATRWWRDREGAVAGGSMFPIVARVDGRVEGVAVLYPSQNPNSRHRAEVGKVIVHRRARRRGLGAGLMAAIEALARDEGRWLLLLDTYSGSDADRLYRRLGWIEFGVVPDHALTADGELARTTYFRKDLRDEGDRS